MIPTAPTIRECDEWEKAGYEVTEAMVSGGIFALRGKCSFDVAFPAGGEDEAVEAVLKAAIAAKYLEDSGNTQLSFLDILFPEQCHQ